MRSPTLLRGNPPFASTSVSDGLLCAAAPLQANRVNESELPGTDHGTLAAPWDSFLVDIRPAVESTSEFFFLHCQSARRYLYTALFVETSSLRALWDIRIYWTYELRIPTAEPTFSAALIVVVISPKHVVNPNSSTPYDILPSYGPLGRDFLNVNGFPSGCSLRWREDVHASIGGRLSSPSHER